jgi:hypothetical protein
MPSPNSKLLRGGLWPRHETPSENEYAILLHLAGSTVARLIVRGDQRWGHDAGVTNSEHEPGFESDRSDMTSLLTDWNNTESFRPWVTVDEEYGKQHNFSDGTKAYRLNDKGFEAIAQYKTWRRYDTERIDLACKILNEERKTASALKPK